MGTTIGAIKGDTRSLDCNSHCFRYDIGIEVAKQRFRLSEDIGIFWVVVYLIGKSRTPVYGLTDL